MNFRTVALRKIFRDIPLDILKRAFQPTTQRNGFKVLTTNESLESIIEREVIREQFLSDVDLLIGQETQIQLNPAWMHIPDNNSMVFYIPKSATNGKSITQVHSYRMGSIRHGSANYSYGLGYNMSSALNGFGGGDLLAASVATLASQASVASIEQPHVELIDDNVVQVKMISKGPLLAVLHCSLENDPDLRHIKSPYFPKIASIVVELTKHMIYTRLLTEQERGFITGGQTLGEVKNMIDSYADAGKNYDEMLDEQIVNLFILGDADRKRNHINVLMSSY